MGSRENPLLKKPPLLVSSSKAHLLRLVSNCFDKTRSSLISRWQMRRLTLISPTQRWGRQRPKFSPASRLEWLENLKKRPPKKVLLHQQRRRRNLQKRPKQLRRRLTSTWKTQR